MLEPNLFSVRIKTDSNGGEGKAKVSVKREVTSSRPEIRNPTSRISCGFPPFHMRCVESWVKVSLLSFPDQDFR